MQASSTYSLPPALSFRGERDARTGGECRVPPAAGPSDEMAKGRALLYPVNPKGLPSSVCVCTACCRWLLAGAADKRNEKSNKLKKQINKKNGQDRHPAAARLIA